MRRERVVVQAPVNLVVDVGIELGKGEGEKRVGLGRVDGAVDGVAPFRGVEVAEEARGLAVVFAAAGLCGKARAHLDHFLLEGRHGACDEQGLVVVEVGC